MTEEHDAYLRMLRDDLERSAPLQRLGFQGGQPPSVSEVHDFTAKTIEVLERHFPELADRQALIEQLRAAEAEAVAEHCSGELQQRVVSSTPQMPPSTGWRARHLGQRLALRVPYRSIAAIILIAVACVGIGLVVRTSPDRPITASPAVPKAHQSPVPGTSGAARGVAQAKQHGTELLRMGQSVAADALQATQIELLCRRTTDGSIYIDDELLVRAKYADKDGVARLLSRGANVNHQFYEDAHDVGIENGKTALMLALESGSAAVANVLLDQPGIDVDIQVGNERAIDCLTYLPQADRSRLRERIRRMSRDH